jgi:hypothetical protein
MASSARDGARSARYDRFKRWSSRERAAPCSDRSPSPSGPRCSDAGSIRAPERTEAHVAIVTYWRSFEEHERSHAIELCSESTELGYDLLWQGDYARSA